MGLKQMLNAGIEKEGEKLNKLKKNDSSDVKKPQSSKKTEKAAPVKVIPEPEIKDEPVKPVKTAPVQEKRGRGRPSLASRGKAKRKQIAITILPSDYDKITEAAERESISIAKYIERAVREYNYNHNI